MSQLSIRVESIGLGSNLTTSSGQISTPNQQSNARRGSDPLSFAQVAARIGDPVPIVFGLRVGDFGGILISPKATEARFSNNASNEVTASYHLLLSEGELDMIQIRDVFQQSCRVGFFTQAYNRRAGDWGPGNFIAPQTGFENEVPDAPIFCGSATGSYERVTTGSFTVTIPAGFTQWDRQVHAFIRGGMHVNRLLDADSIGPSNNVVDLVWWLLTRSTRLPEGLIDKPALINAAQFTSVNGFNCDIEINEPSNLADWFSKNLGYFLLRESRRSGKKGLRPLLPANADGTININQTKWVFTFTEDHILPGSIELTYSSRVERRPFCVQMIWRQQPDDALGLARTTEVRYAGSAIDGPYEQHDISEFCTNENHAVKVGAYILARRRYIDHRLAFTVRSDAFNSSLAPGDIVRVRLRRIPSVGIPQAHDYLYEVDRIGRGINGEIQLELTHFPVDAQGRSLVALDVSIAVGRGLLLPTGRADINCDLNDPFDFNFNLDLGPWAGWEIPDFDLPLFDLDDLDDLLELLEIDDIDDLITLLGLDDLNGLLDLLGLDDLDGLDLDDILSLLDLDDILSLLDLDQLGLLQDTGDGWGSGLEEFEDATLDTNDWGFDEDLGIGVLDIEDDRNGSISFTQTIVTYPDVWYAILQPNFANVKFRVTVSPAPEATPLLLRVSDGSVNDFNPDAGQFGGENVYSITIPVGETTSELVTINAKGDSLTEDTARNLKVVSYSGGRYLPGPADEEALDISATGSYDIKAYVGAISLQQPGVWQYDGEDESWVWAGPDDTGDFEWNESTQKWDWTGINDDWNWDTSNQRWDYIGSATGWSWQAGTQRWLRTTDAESADPKPDNPPAGPISPAPDSLPPATDGTYFSVVAVASVDKVPTDIVSGLELTITDFVEDTDTSTEMGVMTIPGVPMMFGNWRWNPAVNGWEYRNAPSSWLWTGSAWEYIGSHTGEWVWSMENGWEWTGSEDPEGSAPTTQPPTQNNSIHPPDAERWTWTGTAWSGTAQVEGGTAPLFDGLLFGTFTYHLLIDEPE